MSTNHPKSGLISILNYGYEAFQNRRKYLFSISYICIFIPAGISLLAWLKASNAAALSLKLPTMSELTPMMIAESVISDVCSVVLVPTMLALFMYALGLLALAITCLDYFESRPGTLSSVFSRALRILLTKGFGVILFFVVTTPFWSMLPLLRAIALSIIMMLPVTLCSSHTGGFKTSLDTFTLRYSTLGRGGWWPTMINILSINGLCLSLFFMVAIAIESIPTLDLPLESHAGFFSKVIHVGEVEILGSAALTDLLGLLWVTTATALIIPFTAAIYHFATIPRDHEPFKTAA